VADDVDVPEYASLLFGSHQGLEDTRAAIASRLDVTFTLHDSSYRNGDYYMGLTTASSEEWFLQDNLDQDERAEPDWEGPTILYVEATRRPEEIVSGLADVLELVRSQHWERREPWERRV
jgi:hypothetical protein